MKRALLLAALFGALLWAAPSGAAESPAPGAVARERLWEIVSAPFRRRALPEPPPAHTRVARGVAVRRAMRSPFMVPVGEGGGATLLPSKGPGKILSLEEGTKLIALAGKDLDRMEQALETGPWDKLAKEVDALSTKLASSIFPNRAQRLQAQALSARALSTRQRVGLRQAFAKLNPRVTFIIWSPEGRSLAVVNRRVMHPGETLAPGVVLSEIGAQDVTFDLQGEKIVVGLR